MHSLTSTVKTKVTGLDKIKRLFDFRQHLGTNVNSTIDVHANDSSLRSMNSELDRIKNRIHNMRGDNHLPESFVDTRREINGASESLNPFSSHIRRATEATGRMREKAHSVRGAFKAAFAGSFISNWASSAFNDIKTVTEAGWKLNMAGKKAQVTWRHIGLSNGQSNDMVKQMDKIRDTSDVDEQTISSLQKRFYTLTGSAGRARSLTNEMTAFGRASGASSQDINRLGRTLPRMLSSSKIRGQMFNRTFSRTPAIVGALAKASGRSKKSFLALVDSGKMTGQQLQQYLGKAAKYSGKAWNEYAKTASGRIAYLRGLARESEEKATSGLTSSFVKGLDKIGSKNKNLMQVRKSLAGIAGTLGRKVGNFAGKAIAWIVKNQKPLLKTGTALMRIAGIAGKAVWRSFSSIFSSLFGSSKKDSKGINGVANALTRFSKHTKAIRAMARAMAGFWLISKASKFVKILRDTNKQLAISKIVSAVAKGYKALASGESVATVAQKGLNWAMRTNPIGIVITAVGALAIGFIELYKHCRPFRHFIQTVGHVGSEAMKVIWNGLKAVGKLAVAVIKADLRPYIGVFKFLGRIGKKVFGMLRNVAGGVSRKIGHFVGGLTNRINRSNNKVYGSTRRSARKSTHAVHGYLSKSGKYYKHYHKGLIKMSAASYKERERMRKRYASRAKSSLRKYERSYKKYEDKRSSLSRKYGKLRAMYSVKSLRLIESRFRKLRSNILKATKGIYKDTQKWFKKIGKGSASQFKGIYKAVRRWLGRSNKLMVKDFKAINKNSRKFLDGSVKRYVKELRYRFKQQRYYDGQLVRQTKRTNRIMNKLPLKWVWRETKLLIKNWKRQRKSFITHNKRMTKALVTHIHTMSHHLRNFSKSFKDIFGDLEDNIYDKWTKFWKKMHDAAGHGINSVQTPLNTGAEHLNGFVRAFGETSAPLHRMPSVSYATGTGALDGISSIRRPITQLTSAILNDDTNNGQETVIHANGSIEKPQGPNVHEMLEPGAEVLNASETKLMDALSQPVHLATGTGFFSGLKSMLSGLSDFGGLSQSILLSQAKGSGDKRLLHELQKVLKNSAKVFSGFMGGKPSGFRGIINDIVQGAFAQTTGRMNGWWKALMNLTNQSLNNGGSSSELLNYAAKNFSGIRYSMGGMSKAAADCSGAVDMIAKHFGIDLPRTTTGMEADSKDLQYLGKDESKARAGDLVLFGHGNGAAGHVGIYSGKHDIMWNETPPRSRFSRISDAESTVSLAGFYRLKHLAQDNKGPSFKGASKGLMKFVKVQEKPMFKWIAKHLAPLLNPDPGGGPGVAKWRPVIEDAAKAMGVHLTTSGLNKVLSNIRHESGGDEKVTQHVSDVNSAAGDPAKGLVQFIPPTFRHYAVAGHDNILNGYDQLLALFNDSNWYSDIAPGGGWGPTGSRRHYKGGRFKAGDLFSVGEKGPELIKPDFSGEVIPNNESKRVINNSRKPVNVKQDIHITVKGGSRADDSHIVNILQHYGDKLARKLSGGERLVY